MTNNLHIELYYADGVPASKQAEQIAVKNIYHWLSEVKDAIAKAGGKIHYEIGFGKEYRIFLESINDALAKKAYDLLYEHKYGKG